MINLELYKIFKIVAEEENLTRASEVLNISQPAVTKHIHNLEDELRVKLFTRAKYGMILTEDGKRIYEQVKDSINVLVSIEDNLKKSAILNLGIHTNFPQKIYSEIIENLKRNNKNMDVTIEKTYTENMFVLLEKQQIDAYLSKKQPDDIHSESIKFFGLGYFHDDFFVASNSKYLHKNILKDTTELLNIYTLRNISSTSNNLERMIKEKALNNIEIKNTTFSTIYEKMQSEDIIAYITEEYIKEDLGSGKVKRLDTGIQSSKIEYGIYYNTKNKIKNIKKIFRA